MDAQVGDVVGLYLNSPTRRWWSVSTKIADPGAAPDRADATDPPRAAGENHPRPRAPRHYHLFAALEVATGKITDACHPRHTHAEFLAFLKQVAKAYPRVPLHVVADNYATHKHPAVKPGWPSTRECGCISPRPPDRG